MQKTDSISIFARRLAGLPHALLRGLASSARETGGLACMLFKITFPLMIVIKILDDEFGAVEKLGALLSWPMAAAGLPGEAGVVWAAAILLNIYAGLLLLFSMWDSLQLSGAQATALAVMMLTAHALPVEGRIAQKAGVRLWWTIVLRLGGAIILSAALFHIYAAGGWLQEPAQLLWHPPPEASAISANEDWRQWLMRQGAAWARILPIIFMLVVLLKIMRALRIEAALTRALRPLLSPVGIGREATSTTLVGMTLGVSYGGALLIQQARRGEAAPRDLFCAFCFLALCHSVIEDTAAFIFAGGHISGVLFARMIFAFGVIFVVARVAAKMPDAVFFRWFFHRPQ